MSRKPVMLMILDGWGLAPAASNNAISKSQTPNWNKLWAERPHTEIAAHGEAVGLPPGQMGNSEVGHLNLGAGRVVMQDLMRINDAIETGAFNTNTALTEAAAKVKAQGGKIHLMGLCSPGGVHSSLEHLYAAVNFFAQAGLQVFLHAITDGRDTPPSSAKGYLAEIEKQIAGKAKVATVVGRFWAMDRDKRWDRVSRGYHAFILGEGTPCNSADEGIAAAYADGQTDEFIEPRIICGAEGAPVGNIEDGDGVLFFNFRADRAREITQALAFDQFDGFERKATPKLGSYVCMTEYQADFGLPIAFPPVTLDDILGKVLEDKGLTQFHCAETEKYAHVTFFFNGGDETPFKGEDRVLIPSPKEVATYDLKPEMSAKEVGDAVINAIEKNDHDVYIINFANTDMVGHTGIMEAAIKAAAAVDKQIGRISDAILSKGGALLITADHGNSEQMTDPKSGQPHTAHTTNPVPLVLVDDQRKAVSLTPGGALKDVAPTMLKLLGLDQPAAMTGRCLINE